MERIDFLTRNHQQTERDYVQRVIENDKAECAEVARRWGYDYWDGDRKYGYGGYHYDGRWRPVAEELATHYGLKSGDRILDIGCGKAFLLFELTQVVPGISVSGIDISEYGVNNSKSEIREYLKLGECTSLPYEDHSFDFVVSLNTFHNLSIDELEVSIREMVRVGRGPSYICVESYRNEREKVNLLYWQLTCRSFYTPSEWEWFLQKCGYDGDVGYIFFE